MSDETRDSTGADAGTSPAASAAEAPAHARSGEVLANWINLKLTSGPPAVLRLGTKRATVLELLSTGALRVEVEGESGRAPEPQLVALDGPRLEALLRRLLTGR